MTGLTFGDGPGDLSPSAIPLLPAAAGGPAGPGRPGAGSRSGIIAPSPRFPRKIGPYSQIRIEIILISTIARGIKNLKVVQSL